MSREIKEFIEQLEKERDEIVSFYEEVQAEVKSGELTPKLAEEILKREFQGHAYKEAVALKNKYISEARAIIADQRTEIVHTAAPVAVLLILAVAFAWNFGAITGLFTFDDETFYRYDVGQEYTSDSVLVLPITTNISSLRVDGEMTGTGNARIWLHTGNTRRLVATFDHNEEEPSGLTGFAIDEAPGQQDNNGQGPPNIPPGQEKKNETPAPPVNETPIIVPPVNETPIMPPAEETPAAEEPAPVEETPPAGTPAEEPATEAPVEEPTTPPAEIPTEETPVEEPVVETPPAETPAEETPPVTEEPVVLPPSQQQPEQQKTIKTAELNNVCLETCNLIGVSAPYQLQIDISGDVTVRLDTIIYGELPENITEPPVNETPAPPVNETPIIVPPVNETPINITPANETPVNVTPANETNVTPLKALGETCVLDTDCVSSICKDNMHQGTLSSRICVADRMMCVADTAYPTGAVLGESICTGGVWLSQSGTGRLEIRTAAGALAAVIDRYGTMAIAGVPFFNTSPADDGWVIKDAAGTPKISITEDGTLTATGSLVTRTQPQPTAGGDLIVRATALESPSAVLTEAGDVLIAGDFTSGVTLQ